MSKVVGIFTGKDLSMMESEGGSGYWVAKTNRIKDAEYVLLIRNHRETWAVKDASHGQAFMIGKISGCVPTKKYKGRKIVQISECSLLPDTDDFKNAWKKLTDGQRYPVAYLNTEQLLNKINLDVSELEWSVFNANLNAEKDLKVDSSETEVIDEKKELSEIIDEAKKMIADSADIEIDKISIQINF